MDWRSFTEGPIGCSDELDVGERDTKEHLEVLLGWGVSQCSIFQGSAS